MSEPLARATAQAPAAEAPPLLQSWPRVYAAVLISQTLFAALLWALGEVLQ